MLTGRKNLTKLPRSSSGKVIIWAIWNEQALINTPDIHMMRTNKLQEILTQPTWSWEPEHQFHFMASIMYIKRILFHFLSTVDFINGNCGTPGIQRCLYLVSDFEFSLAFGLELTFIEEFPIPAQVSCKYPSERLWSCVGLWPFLSWFR